MYRLVKFEDEGDKKGFPNDIKCVIVDLGCVMYVDASGVKTLRTVTEEMQRANIEVLLATAASPIFERLRAFEATDVSPVKFKLFPTIHDAVQFAYQRNIPVSVMYESLAL